MRLPTTQVSPHQPYWYLSRQNEGYFVLGCSNLNHPALMSLHVLTSIIVCWLTLMCSTQMFCTLNYAAFFYINFSYSQRFNLLSLHPGTEFDLFSHCLVQGNFASKLCATKWYQILWTYHFSSPLRGKLHLRQAQSPFITWGQHFGLKSPRQGL